jgi:cytochrome P450
MVYIFLFPGQKFAIMEMKAALSAMLRRYKLSLENPNADPHLIAELVLKSARGINLKLEPRALAVEN